MNVDQSTNQHPPEPSETPPISNTATATAARGGAGGGSFDDSPRQQQQQQQQQQVRLKDRIKRRAMQEEAAASGGGGYGSPPPEATFPASPAATRASASSAPARRRDSVLDAASALASLGVTSPASTSSARARAESDAAVTPLTMAARLIQEQSREHEQRMMIALQRRQMPNLSEPANSSPAPFELRPQNRQDQIQQQMDYDRLGYEDYRAETPEEDEEEDRGAKKYTLPTMLSPQQQSQLRRLYQQGHRPRHHQQVQRQEQQVQGQRHNMQVQGSNHQMQDRHQQMQMQDYQGLQQQQQMRSKHQQQQQQQQQQQMRLGAQMDDHQLRRQRQLQQLRQLQSEQQQQIQQRQMAIARRHGRPYDQHPDVLAVHQQMSRPFASLLGSDVPLTFPQKLMEVLSNPEVSSVITWLPHGKGFIILQKRRFALEVMPLYFKHSKFTSFTRKLNRWGFARVSRGPEMGAYYHKYFQRGNHLLCMQMHCQSTNKSAVATKKKAAAKKEEEDHEDEDREEAVVDGEGAVPPSPDAAAPDSQSPRASSPAEAAERPAVETIVLDEDEDSEMVDAAAPPPAATAGADAGAESPNGSASGGATLHRSPRSNALAMEGRQRHDRAGNNHEETHRRNHYQELIHHDHGLHRAGQDGNPRSEFNHAFSRQQEILRGEEGEPPTRRRDEDSSAHQRDRRDAPSFRLIGSNGEVNQYQRGPAQQQPHSLQRHAHQVSSIQRRPQPGHSASSSRPTSNDQDGDDISRSIAISRLMGVDTSSSRNHALIMSNAMRALREGPAAAANNGGGAEEPSSSSSYQAQSRVHSAMQARLRQIEEYNQERARNMATGGSGATSFNSTANRDRQANRGAQDEYAALLSQYLEESSGRASKGGGSGTATKSTSHKMGSGQVLPQNEVARIRQYYSGMSPRQSRQDQQGAASGGGGVPPSSRHPPDRADRKYHRPVRRASAA